MGFWRGLGWAMCKGAVFGSTTALAVWTVVRVFGMRCP